MTHSCLNFFLTSSLCVSRKQNSQESKKKNLPENRDRHFLCGHGGHPECILCSPLRRQYITWMLMTRGVELSGGIDPSLSPPADSCPPLNQTQCLHGLSSGLPREFGTCSSVSCVMRPLGSCDKGDGGRTSRRSPSIHLCFP